MPKTLVHSSLPEIEMDARCVEVLGEFANGEVSAEELKDEIIACKGIEEWERIRLRFRDLGNMMSRYNVVLRNIQSRDLSWIGYESKESFDRAFNILGGGLKKEYWLVAEGVTEERAYQIQEKGLRVKIVRYSPYKVEGFFEQNQGKVFEVIQRREGGYDVDLAPLGHPGEMGFMYDEQVDEVNEHES